MTPTLLDRRLSRISGLPRYQKPPAGMGAKMDSNENLAIPASFAGRILRDACGRVDIRQYPLGGAERLARALATYLDIPQSMISVGNGSDQILDHILAHLAGPGATITATDPTFSFFEDRCRLHDIRLNRAPYSDDMTISADDILGVSGGADLIYLDSPNNPTGYQIPRADLSGILQSFQGPVMIDEAYADFAPYMAYTMVRRHPNLMVLRTLSKSFGLAGLRVGYVVARPGISGPLSGVVQHPYPVSSISVESAILALERFGEAAKSWQYIRAERERIISSLRKHDSLHVFDSAANFVLFRAGGAARRIHRALAEQGILVRFLDSPRDCLRVTVATKDMNSRFLLAVRDLLK